MHEKLASHGRQLLKELLAQCTAPQVELFKLMYARDGGKRSVEDAKTMDINTVVDQMEEKNISHALSQCESTVSHNRAGKATE